MNNGRYAYYTATGIELRCAHCATVRWMPANAGIFNGMGAACRAGWTFGEESLCSACTKSKSKLVVRDVKAELLEERRALEGRIARLTDYMRSGASISLTEHHRAALNEQRDAMKLYSGALALRIGLLTVEADAK